MKTKLYRNIILTFAAGLVAASCNTDQLPQPPPNVTVLEGAQVPSHLTVTPQAIPGSAKSDQGVPTGGYAPTGVQAKLNIDVKDGTKEITVVRDNTDPFVITKPYTIKNADPYAVRSYLEAAVGARSVSASPAQATAVKFDDGTGVVLVSAEEYRFSDNEDGRGIDSIVAALDRKGLTYSGDAGTRIYFPRASKAANLRDMLLKVGSSDLDPQFEISPSTILVDGELNALVICAPEWSWEDMRKLLVSYDRPIPEVKISYRIIEIYAENDDRIGVDFQSWKNNEGVDLFSAGAMMSRNWGTFFTSSVQDTSFNKVSYWNFNPKWNSRYLDFMTSIGKAKILARGEIVAQNRTVSTVQVASGFFYDRTFYTAGAKTIAEGTGEFAYTDPNPDTILREALTKIQPYSKIKELYKDAGDSAIIRPDGYTLRTMGTQTGTNTYGDVSALVFGNDSKTSPLAKFLTGYVKADGTVVNGAYYNTNWDNANAAPGIIHGWLQYPMVTDGFQFDLRVTPVVTSKAAKITFDLDSISLLGWNADGSARMSKSQTGTTFQIGTEAEEFVIGGLKKSESVRSTAGLPFLKDIPVLGRALSTESESIKQSQLVVVARVEYSNPDDKVGADISEDLGKIVKSVNKGMTSRVGNMFFQQYGLDEDRADRVERLDKVGNFINDDYQEMK